jgi:transposase InsO family protein
LTPEGRRRLCERVDAGRPICHVASEAGISRQTLGKWYARWREGGREALHDRSSAPSRHPNQTPARVEDLVEAARRTYKVGPVQLVSRIREDHGLTLAASTISAILTRRGISRLRDLDVDGRDLREPVRRYEWPNPGDMVHIDVKKIGRIPDGGGWAVHGRGSPAHRASRSKARRRPGYVYLHSALDDRTRLAYTEEHDDEKGTTAAGFWARAATFFAQHGITEIARVLTDNGACYRSAAFRDALAPGTRHKRTRPYRPQTNGKVERYQQTLSREWARSQAWNSNEHRSSQLQPFLDRYNYHRAHTALGGLSPISRCPDTNVAA